MSRIRLLVGLLAALAVTLAALPALADRRVALVLGVERYAALRPLDNPVNDSRALTALLEDRLGFEAEHRANRSLAQMRRALADFAEDAAGADLAVLFFAGHGVEIAGRNYLLPADAVPGADLAASALPLDEAVAALRAAVPNLLVILDACRDDPFAAAPATGRGATAIAPPPGAAPGLRLMGRSEGVVYAFAAAPGETASDGAGTNSPFTEALLRHLATDGVDVRSALLLVQQDVYDRTRGAQLPYVESGLPRPVFLAEPAADLPERDRLLLAMADLSPDLRAQVERAAETHDTPLAPLYAAALEGDLAALGWEAREAKLAEAAEAFRMTRERLLGLESTDYRVRELRAEAEALLELGEREAALDALRDAEAIDAQARAASAAVLVERSISEADTRIARASIHAAGFDYPAALEAYSTAADLYASATAHAAAAGSEPPRAALVGRGGALSSMGDLHLTTGDSTAALAAYRAALELAASTAASAPDDVSWQRALSISHEKVGDVLLHQNDLPYAAREYAAALAIDQRLTQLDPDNVAWQRDLSFSYERIGDWASARQDWGTAADYYEKSLDIRRRLAELNPGNAVLLGDLSAIRDRIGDVHMRLGDLAGAAREYRASLSVRKRLVALDPENAGRQRDLAVVYERVGDVLMARTDIDGAAREYTSALAIHQRLVTLDPENADWQRDLAASHVKVGNVLMAQDDLDGARQAYSVSLAIHERLTSLDPENAAWQRGLLVSHGKVGDVLMGQGDRLGAAREYAASYAISRQMAGAFPESVQSQLDLAVSHWNLALVGKEPRENLRRGLAILRALEDAWLLSPAYTGWIAAFEDQLATLPPP